MNTKICSSCHETKSLEDFSKNKIKKDGHSGECRACKKEYQAAWYEKNKDSHRARVNVKNKEYRKTIRDIIVQNKNVPCADCKVSYPPYVMDFDHLPGTVKSYNVALMGKHFKTVEEILNEISKCEVVCSNCHRQRTWARNQASKGL